MIDKVEFLEANNQKSIIENVKENKITQKLNQTKSLVASSIKNNFQEEQKFDREFVDATINRS